MTQVQSAPIYAPVIEGNKGKATLPWTLFFQQVLAGDNGSSFTPVATGLTVVGTPTITGAYYQNQGWIDFWISIICSAGQTTTSTAGTTYFSLPFGFGIDAASFTIIGVASGTGVCQSATQRVYPAGWNTNAAPVTITGRVLVQ